MPNGWVGPTTGTQGSLGDPGTGDAPPELCTNVPCGYQQMNNPYCITYCFASALLYCERKDPATWTYEAAPTFSTLDFELQIEQLIAHTRGVIPVIGSPTIYGRRTRRHDHLLRTLTWDDLFNDLTPYPTVVIPKLPDGTFTHAFCVVDDLIFDSTCPCALQLRKESVLWLFQDREVELHHAYRFNEKYSESKKNKTKGEFDRPIRVNWGNKSKKRKYDTDML